MPFLSTCPIFLVVGPIGLKQEDPRLLEDGSPDEICRWLILERDGNEFTMKIASPIFGGDKCDASNVWGHITETVAIDMPTDVLVGLAVMSPVWDDERNLIFACSMKQNLVISNVVVVSE